jgi:hypothetical protein
MKSALLCFVFITLTASFAVSETDQPTEVRQNADLKQLLTEARKMLPKGWRAEITPDVPEELIVVDKYRFQTCHLLIWHEEKTLGRRPIINDRSKTKEELEFDYKPEAPKVDLAIVKYVSPAAYDKLFEENSRRQTERLTFEKKYLSAIQGFDYVRPFAPSLYHPSSDAEKELLREYTLLWTRTELEELPNYYYRTLSFDSTDLNPVFGLRFKDERIQAEQDQIREAILKIITVYPEKKLPDHL